MGDRQGNSGKVHQASAQVSRPGLVETALPAGVFFGTDYEDFARPCDGVTARLRYQILEVTLEDVLRSI